MDYKRNWLKLELQANYERGREAFGKGAVFIPEPGFIGYRTTEELKEFNNLPIYGDLEEKSKIDLLTNIIDNLPGDKFVYLRLTRETWLFGKRYLVSGVEDRIKPDDCLFEK